jgi:hypothetical protein
LFLSVQSAFAAGAEDGQGGGHGGSIKYERGKKKEERGGSGK